MRLQCIYNFGNCRCFLSDCNIDTDYIFAFLIQNCVQSNGCLSRLTVSNDQLTLSTTDRKHCIDGKNTGFHRDTD